MAEYAEVLARPKFRRLDRAAVAAVLELFGAIAVEVRPRVKSALSPDASDNCFYECAQAARAD